MALALVRWRLILTNRSEKSKLQNLKIIRLARFVKVRHLTDRFEKLSLQETLA